jgi:hypothetical protein
MVDPGPTILWSRPVPAASADLNLLFGILAVQLDFVSRHVITVGTSAMRREGPWPLRRFMANMPTTW